jgi:hypothetical protein
MQTFTINEITRLGLLKNHLGKPYAHRGTVSRIVRGLKFKTVLTAFGEAKVVTKAEIDRFNQKWASLSK